MTIIINKKEKKKIIQQVIFEAEPNIKSRAAYLLLKEKYTDESDFDEKEKLEEYLDFRNNFLDKKLKEDGKLICAYCHRDDLEKGGRHSHSQNNKNKKLATIDHVIPVSKGGEKLDENNCVVSCKSCNNRKGDSLEISVLNEQNHLIWGRTVKHKVKIEFRESDTIKEIIRVISTTSKQKAKNNTTRWFRRKYDKKDLIKVTII